MADSPVRFGTDGWRAIIAEDFTFENVRACAQATADHFANSYGTGRPMVVGWDTRFLSEDFAIEVARVLAGNGFQVDLADRSSPTPALSYRVVQRGACGGVMVTSSHNPARWNGIKIKPHYGGSAGPEVVGDIERRVPRIMETAGAVRQVPATSDAITRFDPLPGYLAALRGMVDLGRIRGAGLRVGLDPMFGTASGIFETLLEGGSTTVSAIHSEYNPGFPGLRAPEPIEQNLGSFMRFVRERGCHAGIANDGDADRVGLVDENGAYVDQLRTFALLVNYLLGVRGLRGPIVRSITTTRMANILARHYGVECIETPVGFKHIGPLMMERDALIGGEESGGYGFRGHLPERDGVLAGLFLLDYVAATGKPPSKLVEDVFAITGAHHYQRLDFDLEPGANAAVRQRLDEARPSVLAGCRVVGTDRTDGWRFLLDDGWLLFRLSGTEPLLRIYVEVLRADLVQPLIEAGRQLAGY